MSHYMLSLSIRVANEVHRELLDQYNQTIQDATVAWRDRMRSQAAKATSAVPNYEEVFVDMPSVDYIYDVTGQRSQRMLDEIETVAARANNVAQMLDDLERVGVIREDVRALVVQDIADTFEDRPVVQG